MDRLMVDGRRLPDRIGEVAGRVWRQLRTHGPQAPRDIARTIGRPEIEVHQALGWLAREGKLRPDSEQESVALAEHEMSIAP
jgi:hypothetical protein